MTSFSDIDLSVVEEETAKLILKLALDDLADVLPADCLPLDEDLEMVLKIQAKEYNDWFSIVQDAKLAKSIDDALATDAAYLDAFITAEEAAKEDRIAAELLSRGEALPVRKSCQTRLEDPAFSMDPVADAMSSDHADSELDTVENGLLDEAIDNEWTHGESVCSGDHLMQDLVN
jgi:hypothetical protein